MSNMFVIKATSINIFSAGGLIHPNLFLAVWLSGFTPLFINPLETNTFNIFLARLFSKIEGVTLVKNNQLVENIDYFTSLMDLPRIFYDFQDEFLYKDKYINFIKEDIFQVKNKDKS